MKSGSPPLNILLSVFYTCLSTLLIYLLKLALRPLQTTFSNIRHFQRDIRKQQINYSKLMALSWLKKYTLLGSCLSQDKKYLTKQFLFMSSYAVSSLNINRIFLAPCIISIAILPPVFVIYEIVLKKYHKQSLQQQRNPSNKTLNANSQIQIEPVNLQNLRQTQNQLNPNQSPKNQNKTSRTLLQLIIISSLAFASILMLFQTIMILSNSVSNSGQLNLISLLIAFSIDQIVIRVTLGLGTILFLIFLDSFDIIKINQNWLINLLCEQELTAIMIQSQIAAKTKKQMQQTASPIRHRSQPIQRTQQVHTPNNENHIDLFNLKPNNIIQEVQEQQQQEQNTPKIQNPVDDQQVFLNTAEKELFERLDFSQNSNELTDNTHNVHSNQCKVGDFSIDGSQPNTNQDAIILNELVVPTGPLQDIKNIQSVGLSLDSSPVNHIKRKGVVRKKNNRVLQLTGNSPYLQYLPNMLKKVDQYKQTHKQKKII